MLRFTIYDVWSTLSRNIFNIFVINVYQHIQDHQHIQNRGAGGGGAVHIHQSSSVERKSSIAESGSWVHGRLRNPQFWPETARMPDSEKT